MKRLFRLTTLLFGITAIINIQSLGIADKSTVAWATAIVIGNTMACSLVE